MKKTFLFAILLCAINTHFFNAQYQLSGIVKEKETNQKIAFAHITYNDEKNKGTISSIDGLFKLDASDEIKTIKISCLGYQNLILSAPFKPNQVYFLQMAEESLDEIVINFNNKENPALEIIRQVIANKNKNNPLKKGGFSYESYSKTLFKIDSLNVSNSKKDSPPSDDKIKLISENGDYYVFVMEAVTKRKFLPPSYSNEEVIATKASGFKNPYFASLATEIQPFGFYNEYFELLDNHFLNPISNNAISQYDYVLEDTFDESNHQIHLISFKPKPNKNFEGLKGFMYIHTNGFAIKNIVAEPFDDMKLKIKIQQQYAFLDNKHWFPQELNYEFKANAGVKVDGKTYIKEVVFNPELKARDFSAIQLSYSKDAPKQSDDFWAKYRQTDLSLAELETYRLIDSLGQKNKFDRILDITNKLSTGNIGYGKFDFPINRFFNYNDYEGLRLGIGLYTNEKFIDFMRIGGYVGYGIKDKQFKYGADLNFILNKKNETTLALIYSKDLREIGQQGLARPNDFLGIDLRNFMASQMDFVNAYTVEFKSRINKFLTAKLNVSHQNIDPLYNSLLENQIDLYNPYNLTTINTQFRFAFFEKIIDNFFSQTNLGSKYPVILIDYTKGLNSNFQSDFEFNKIELKLSHHFYTNRFGKTTYAIQAGIIDEALPTGLLFTGEGSFNKNYPYVINNHFQTMLPYEFISDRYIHLFFKHDIGSLLFKSKSFSPGFILHHNVGWGDLVNKPQFNNGFNIKNKIFMESGVELTKLLKINYLDIGYLGLGAGVFYRHNPYQFEQMKDNFAFKLNMSFSLN